MKVFLKEFPMFAQEEVERLDIQFIYCNKCGHVNYEDCGHQVYKCLNCGKEGGLAEGYVPDANDEISFGKYIPHKDKYRVYPMEWDDVKEYIPYL